VGLASDRDAARTTRTEANVNEIDASLLERRPMTSGSRLSLAFANLRGLIQDHALLAVLEIQRAGISLIKIIVAGIMISILVVSAWMAIVAAVVVWAVGAGANWGLAILVAALVNVGVAVGLAFWAKRQVPDLLFAATLRQLRKDVPRTESEHAPNRSVA
jgi:uncharacterized membrane protein YqjE